VPRGWTNLVAIASDQDIEPDTQLPSDWREELIEAGFEVASSMTDDRNPSYGHFAAGFNPADPIDQAIMATRKAVFPEHGLDPLMD